MEYMRYNMMHREQPTHVQQCERLQLEFLCDAMAVVEARELAFHATAAQQAKYRSASAKAIIDQVSAHLNAGDIGNPVVLPASFVGSPKYYHKLYLDAMALPRRFSKPDLFITMTCNPNWREIKENVPNHSHWKHHPDIVARVFLLKFNAMMDLIVGKKLFGKVLAHVHRIEWQARGLPHAHVLIILENKVISPRHIDEIVCAEVPCPRVNAALHAIVTRTNIHSPCDCSPASGCRTKSEDGSCFRKFPKSMSDSTSTRGDGYPQYRRRGRYSTVVGDRIVTDEWVVPYNPMLLLMFDCHINVEVAAHKRCFKYVYKYVFKSPDHATVCVDEINAFLSGRMLSASEAAWRLLGLKLHKEFPSVFRLDVHLPDCPQVIFDPESDPRDLIEAAERQTSTLLEWFHLNNRDAEARQWLYKDIPEHYAWKHGSWFAREDTRMSVGRLYGVSQRNVELHALRCLLDCVKGALSFQDLLTVNNHIYPTFRQACAAWGLSHDDSEWIAAFQEIIDVQIMSLSRTRHAFAMMLINVKALNAQALFNHFAVDLCDIRGVTPAAVASALREIQIYMQDAGKSLEDIDIGIDMSDLPDDSDDAAVSSYYDNDGDDVSALPPMTSEQQTAFNFVSELVHQSNASNNAVAILARAGTGKSIWVHHVVRSMRLKGKGCICVAASALASTVLPHGRTAHAAFKIPVNVLNDTYCSWDAKTKVAIRNCAVILWDEISMVSTDVAEAVNRSLQSLMKNDHPFGGKVVVFLGDFRQLAPVVRHSDAARHSLLSADWFQEAHKFTFTVNFRAASNAQFASFLESVGDGAIDTIDVPESSRVVNVATLLAATYPDITNYSSNSMILAMTLDQCAVVNSAALQLVPGEAHTAIAVDDTQACQTPDLYPLEYIASLNLRGVPPAHLILKKHARYMIIRNYSPPSVCNGTLCEMLTWTTFTCQVRLLNGPGAQRIVIFPRCSFTIDTENSGLPFTFNRIQFPIIPAYCVTIHKSQGQTLANIGLIMEADAFAHGLIYVALSRVQSWDRIKFCSPRNETFMKNKVNKALLALLRDPVIR